MVVLILALVLSGAGIPLAVLSKAITRAVPARVLSARRERYREDDQTPSLARV